MLAVFVSKKGVSPLIATVLLIAFAVALGSVVMNWGLSLDLGKAKDACNDVQIRIRETESYEVCFGGVGQNGYINFVMDNIGSTDISGLAVWIVGDKSTALSDLDSITIKKGALYDKKDKDVAYDFTKFGKIKQVQFIPKIKVEQATEICPKSAIKAEKIGVCA